MPKLLCFGAGFSANALIDRLKGSDWTFAGTSRDAVKRATMAAQGLEAHEFSAETPLPASAFEGVTHILHSVPPGEDGDPVITAHGADLPSLCPDLEWLGYLSTTGVYGDHQGDWVDEETPLTPASQRGTRRVHAERGWLHLHIENGLPVHIFRLAGIYGPGRNALESVLSGKARRIVKPGQIFSRIHVADITATLAASIAKPNPGQAYNVCDDAPCPPADVITYACELLGADPPPLEDYETAQKAMSPMARSFYGESKRCRNTRIKGELGVTLLYPSYREGLKALLPSVTKAPIERQ